jgi:hypothetical protein
MTEDGAGVAELLVDQLVYGNSGGAGRIADLMRTTMGQEQKVTGTEMLSLATHLEPKPT